MPKLKETAEKNKKRLVLVFWAIVAAVAGITAISYDDEICQQFEGCKAAYDAGSETPAAEPSPTTVQ